MKYRSDCTCICHDGLGGMHMMPCCQPDRIECYRLPGMKFWLYVPRNHDPEIYPGDHDGFVRARAHQDKDNRCSIEEAQKMGLEVGGSEEEGRFYVDDGGDITLVEVQ